MAERPENPLLNLLTIRNLLLLVTLILTIGVIGLAAIQILNAQADKAQAEQSAMIGETIDSITQLKLAISQQRTIYGSLYGIEEPVKSNLLSQADLSYNVIESSYDNIIASRDTLPDFEGDDALYAGFTQAHSNYVRAAEQAKEDLTLALARRQQRASQFTTVLNGFIDAAAKLRSGYESSFELGSAALIASFRLKSELWAMIEYSGRETAIIGRRIANKSSISEIELTLLGEYSGRVRGSWDRVQATASSSIIDPAISALIDDINDSFGLDSDFTLTKDDVYYGSEDGGAYDISAEEWIDAAESAIRPINAMVTASDAFASKLNTESVDSAENQVGFSFFVLLVAVFTGGVAIFIVLIRVIGPLNAISDAMDVLAGGNLETHIPYADRTDEVGAMAQSLTVFKNNELERKKLEAERQQKEIEDLQRKEEEERTRLEAEEEQRQQREQARTKAREERREAMLSLADQFEASVMAVVEQLSASAQEMEGAASGLTSNADQTMQNAEVVAQAANAANQNAQMVASAAEELSSSVREITTQTNQSSSAARDAVTRTQEASSDISEMVDAARKIGDVVNLINDIAEQTNLLALNATIEAARAGEAGKGFAVVASEVKSLANQTANATSEISSQVEGMQTATNLAVKAMDHIRDVIKDIESTSVSIASAVEEQDASTQEIARNVGEVSSGTEEVTTNIGQVNDGATQTGTAANEVLSAAQHLNSQSAQLKEQVQSFLNTVRASD